MSLMLRGKTHILLVADSETKSESDNWLQFQGIGTQQVEKKRVAARTATGATCIRLAEFFPNGARSRPHDGFGVRYDQKL